MLHLKKHYNTTDHDTGSLKCIKLKDFKKNVNKQKNLMYEIGT